MAIADLPAEIAQIDQKAERKAVVCGFIVHFEALDWGEQKKNIQPSESSNRGKKDLRSQTTGGRKRAAEAARARVISKGQSLTAEVAELKAAGCQRVFQEKISDARSDRKQPARLLAELDEGDTRLAIC
jgi:hypothetical protein